MVHKAFVAIAALIVGLTAVMAVNTLLVAPGRLEAPPANELQVDGDAAARRLADAVRFPTISQDADGPEASDAFRDLHRFLARNFPKVHATLERRTIGDYSLLFRWSGSDPSLEPVLLSAHMDVVPVEPGTEERWTHPPFSGALADGAIWGRGTLDDKVSVLGILEAAEFLLAQSFTPRRTIYFAFGHDEEVGGRAGAAGIAAHLADQGVGLEFTLDEGSVIAHGLVLGVAKPVALIGVAEKGYVSVELTATAEGGHSSVPPLSTAIGRLARAVHRLEADPMPARLTPPLSEMLDYLAPEMSLAQRVVLANRWLFEPWLLSRFAQVPQTNALIRTTTAPTLMTGGVAENVLPTEAKAVINFRLLPGDTIGSVMEQVHAIIADPGISVRRIGDGGHAPSAVANSRSSSFAALYTTVRQVFPDVVVAPGLVIAGTDSIHYAQLAKDSYRFLPLRLASEDLERIHGTDERIMIENYTEIIYFYIQLLLNVTP
jgi:carboxypeptidase PM20D1